MDKRVCHRCKEVGHIVRNCPKKPEKKEPDNANANLVIVDNVDDAEYALVSEVMGQFDDANDDNDMDNSLATPAPCNYDSESLITGTSVRHESVPLETTKGPIDDIDIVIDDSDYEHEIALAVPSSGDVTQEEKCDNNQHWFLDSGCSRHMTPSKHEFEKYIELKHPVSVGLADESNILGYGIGNIKIKLFDGNELVPVVIKNVLFVPKLKRKLLSITDITDRGSSVTFKEKSCTLKMKDKTFLFGQRHGKLWRLYCQREQCFLSSAECFYAKETSLNLWHQRYGHLSHGNLDILNKKNMVEGIGTLDFKNDPKEICEGCVMGKQTRLPFPKKSSRITTKPLELIHSDVCGPISVESIGGSRYFITFIDNYSRFVVTYAMKTKDEALDKFKQYVAMAETKFESRVKKIRNDNGGEYVSKVFDDYLKERGTLDERTVPFTPEQNGISERMNRTLMEKVRSMLYHSKLPLRFWAEALSTATHVRNCSPTSTFDETPYERWNGQKPDVSNLRVFGCKAYAHIPDEKRKKLDWKSEKCIFVGYPTGVKGHKLYNLSTRKMIVRRDITFVENDFNHSIEKNGEPDELLPAICFDFDYDESDNDDDIRGATHDDQEDDQAVPEQDVHVDIERRPRREVNPIDRYGSIATHRYGQWEVQDEVNLAVNDDDPKSYRDAINGPNSSIWKDAADVEMKSILRNKTWELVDLPEGKNAIGSKWVFKTKMNADGSVNKYKARLVAQGFAQQHGIDYEETFAPVVKYVSLRTVFAIANQYNMDMHQMDVNSAYLNGDIDAEIFMRQPEGYIDPNHPKKVCKLRKGLYGLKQGGRIWNAKIDKYLRTQGYNPSDADPCIYVKSNEGKICIIALYIDDTVIASNCEDMMKSAKKMLNEKFDMTDLGEVKSVLGMAVKRNRKEGILTIDQSSYVQNVLKRFGMDNCNPVSTPLEPGKHFTKTPENEEGVDTQQFQALVGSLIYASIATRPDISHSVAILSRHMSKPSKDHWGGAKRVLRYLKGTINLGLTFKRSSDFQLVGYSDADWAGDVDSRKSTSGYIFKIGDCMISWKSQKQSIVALSTTEAEYTALCSATQESVWLRRLLESINQRQNGSTTIFEDNQGAIYLSKNPRDHARTKHIDIKYHYTRDAVQRNIVNIARCDTKQMLADIFTKGLPKAAFCKHREAMKLGPC